MTEIVRSILAETVVPAPLAEVWDAWTTADGVLSFFAPACRIELRPGGAYEMFFLPDAEPGSRGGEGNVVLALQPPVMLSFTWNAPPSLPEVRPQKTHVVVRLRELASGKTQVTLRHDGWGAGGEWDAAFAYFDRVWGGVVLRQLRHRFEVGPVDWAALSGPVKDQDAEYQDAD